MMNQKIQVFLALVVGFVLGFLGGKVGSFSLSGGLNQSAQIQKLQAQIDQAKKFFPPTQEDIRSITGTIKEVRGSDIVLDVLTDHPFDGSPATRTVTVGKDTKIVKNEQKDPAAFVREFTEFQKAVTTQKSALSRTSLIPPMSFRETPAQFSDMKAHMQVRVNAGENIRDKESFTATAIHIYVSSLISDIVPSSGK